MSLEVVPGLPGATTGTEQDFAGDGGGGAGPAPTLSLGCEGTLEDPLDSAVE